MFKALRARVGILSLARTPLRVHSLINQNGYPIERVRLQKPSFRPKPILARLAAFGLCWVVFESLVLSPLAQVAEELDEDEDEDTNEDEDTDSIFIPFPLTTKLVQPPPYRGTDPEWHEYVNFTKSPALGKRIRDELATFVEATAKTSPPLIVRCGKEIRLRRYWLDLDFPTKPPPEFMRSGIEITDNSISWKTRPVDSLTAFRIRQALWPSAVTQSMWSFSKALVAQDTANIARMLGLKTKSQPLFEQILAKHTERFTKLDKNSALAKATQTPNAATTEAPREDQRRDSNSALAKYTYARPDGVAGAAQDKAPQERESNFFKTHMMGALTAFKTKFGQTWRPAPSYPARGCIIVSGLVELDSPRAYLVLDVKAAWDPTTREFDPRCLELVLRRLQMKTQEPYKGK